MTVVVAWYAGVTAVLACVLVVVIAAQWVTDKVRGVRPAPAAVPAATAAETVPAGAAAAGVVAPADARADAAPTAQVVDPAGLPQVDLRPPAAEQERDDRQEQDDRSQEQDDRSQELASVGSAGS